MNKEASQRTDQTKQPECSEIPKNIRRKEDI
jgi:hypothetical protein